MELAAAREGAAAAREEAAGHKHKLAAEQKRAETAERAAAGPYTRPLPSSTRAVYLVNDRLRPPSVSQKQCLP